MPPNPETCHISVIIPAHKEGRLIHRTIRSAVRAGEFARKKGVASEIIIVPDKADEKTLAYLSQYEAGSIRLEPVNYGDLGLTRNHGVKLAKGKYIAFLDGDDLFGKNWLAAMFEYLEKKAPSLNIIVHPQYNIVFENENTIWKQVSSSGPEFFAGNLIENNYWDANCAAKKEIFSDNPYEATTYDGAFGYEDWHFNCETLSRGIEHHIISGTVNFIRKKRTGSLLGKTNHEKKIIRPSKLFDREYFCSACKNGNRQKKFTGITGLLHEYIGIIYNNFKRFIKPFFMSRPKMWNGALFVDNFIKRLLKFLLRFSTVFLRKKNKKIPGWLMEEWKSISRIEPLIFPHDMLLKKISDYKVPASAIAKPYLDLIKKIPENVSHIFLVPWLNKGGADLTAIHYMEALAKNMEALAKIAGNIVAISTANADSVWKKKLPGKVRFIEFGKKYNYLLEDEKEKLLARLFLQVAPKVIHNINSDLGYRIFTNYGKAIKTVSNLYVSCFCGHYTPLGQNVSYSVRFLPECFDNLAGVLFDNKAHIKELIEIYGFEKEKMHVHYQPGPPLKQYELPENKKQLDILWAGRLDHQKRPDILVEIAKKCQSKPFKFHVFGSFVLDGSDVKKKFAGLENLVYHGGFDGLTSLDTSRYDLFLNTSQWEGLPNILLEAISAGLPVLSSHVGGINELIKNNETGFLVSPFDNIKAYVDCLNNIMENRRVLRPVIEAARNLVAKRHSKESFLMAIKNTPGYCLNL